MPALGALLVALMAAAGGVNLCAATMTNSWAVCIQGDDVSTRNQAADALAEKHGFINLGLVSCNLLFL